jgi:translocation and assembly module TamA
VDRQPFGYNMTVKNKFEIGRDLKTWDGQLTSYPQEDQYRNLLAAGALRQDLADQLLDSWHVRFGRTRETETLERLYYAELLSDSTTTGTISDYARAATLNYNWIFRKLDSILLPTRGLAASLETAGGYAFATSQQNGPLGRLKIRAVGYLPLGNSWYSQFRLEGGQVFANDNTGIPDSLKFRAGGDDSVRGYGYRTLGPTQNGITVSGRDLFTASAEIARPISPKLQNIWWAAFVDAGNAADRWADLHPAIGYGLGLRLRSPVGPLRVDVAYGQQVKQVRLHVSIGIAL